MRTLTRRFHSLWFDINQMMPRVAVTVIAMLTFTTAEANAHPHRVSSIWS